MSSSLRRQLSLWVAAMTILGGILAGASSFLLALREANQLQDGELRQVAFIAGRAGGDVLSKGFVSTADGRDPDGRIVIVPLGEVQGADSRSHDLSDLSPNLSEGLHTVLSRGKRWRLFVYTFPTGRRIAVGQLIEARDEIARSSGLSTLLPILLLVPALTVLTAWIIRRALAPVTNLSRQLDRRGQGNLTPLPYESIPSEIEPFLNSINSLMLRLAKVLAQQRRFIADAAHELRTPLAALTLQAENLQNPSVTDIQPRIAKLKEGLERARKLLEQLLSLARHQFSTVDAAEVSFEGVVLHVIEEMVPLAVAKRVDLGCERLESAKVAAFEEGLAVLVRNAIDNAVRHTPSGGAVDVRLYRIGANVCFEVEDTGPGIPVGEEENVFQPFYRLGSLEPGSGLGLAIVRTISDRVGGRVTLANREGAPGAMFRFTMKSSRPT